MSKRSVEFIQQQAMSYCIDSVFMFARRFASRDRQKRKDIHHEKDVWRCVPFSCKTVMPVTSS